MPWDSNSYRPQEPRFGAAYMGMFMGPRTPMRIRRTEPQPAPGGRSPYMRDQNPQIPTRSAGRYHSDIDGYGSTSRNSRASAWSAGSPHYSHLSSSRPRSYQSSSDPSSSGYSILNINRNSPPSSYTTRSPYDTDMSPRRSRAHPGSSSYLGRGTSTSSGGYARSSGYSGSRSNPASYSYTGSGSHAGSGPPYSSRYGGGAMGGGSWRKFSRPSSMSASAGGASLSSSSTPLGSYYSPGHGGSRYSSGYGGSSGGSGRGSGSSWRPSRSTSMSASAGGSNFLRTYPDYPVSPL